MGGRTARRHHTGFAAPCTFAAVLHTHRDFKERSVVLAVAHPNPWASASSYLSSQSLADSRCNLHATSRSSLSCQRAVLKRASPVA